MKVFGWIPVLVALWLCAIAAWGIHGVATAQLETRAVASALRLQGHADMMHDALRGDVLDRMLQGALIGPGQLQTLNATFEAHAKDFDEDLLALEQLALSDEVAAKLASVKPALAAYLDAGRVAMALDGSEADRARLAAFLRQWQALEGPMESLAEVIDRTATAVDERASQHISYAYWGLGIGLVLAILGGAVATVTLRRKITRPLREVVTLSRAVAQGDLTCPLPTSGRDEIGEVVQAVGEMQVRLTEMLDRIRHGANALDATSSELVEGSRQVAQSSELQSEAAMTMAAGVEELTASINEVTQGTEDAHNVSQAASEQCAQSENLVRRVMNDMSSLQVSVKDSAEVIHSLGQQSRSIQAIVQVIKDIADQTNLLALNAAIEAARAGEQGRGFAVVADEVRKLADRTGQSTQQIAQMIDAIQSSVDAAVTGMEHGVQLVDSGTTCAQQAVEAMSNVNFGVLKILGVVDNAAHAMTEQRAAANESAEKVSEVAASAENNANVARNAAASAERLHQLAATIMQEVSTFKTRAAN